MRASAPRLRRCRPRRRCRGRGRCRGEDECDPQATAGDDRLLVHATDEHKRENNDYQQRQHRRAVGPALAPCFEQVSFPTHLGRRESAVSDCRGAFTYCGLSRPARDTRPCRYPGRAVRRRARAPGRRSGTRGPRRGRKDDCVSSSSRSGSVTRSVTPRRAR